MNSTPKNGNIYLDLITQKKKKKKNNFCILFCLVKQSPHFDQEK